MEIKSRETKVKKLNLFFQSVVFTFLFLTFFSCSFKKETPPPSDLINEQQMAVILSDLSLAEAVLNSAPLAEEIDTLKKIDVLKTHHVQYKQFLISFKYYSENPKKLKRIYTEVLDILSKKQK